MEIKEQIKKTIESLPSFDDETLVHYYKCSLSRRNPSEKPLFTQLIKAIESERNKRNKIKPILSEGDPDVGINEEGT